MSDMTVCGVSFKLNRPHKWTVASLLGKMEQHGYIYTSVEDKITKDTPQWLRKVVEFSHHIEDWVNDRRKI